MGVDSLRLRPALTPITRSGEAHAEETSFVGALISLSSPCITGAGGRRRGVFTIDVKDELPPAFARALSAAPPDAPRVTQPLKELEVREGRYLYLYV